MAWFNLVIAGLCEICWAIALKYTDGFSRLGPSIITVAGMIGTFYFLAQLSKPFPSA